MLSSSPDNTVCNNTEDAARLAAIVESSDDAIISKTLDGEILSWNKAAEKIYGYTAEEAIGQSISILAPWDVRNEFPSILQKIGRSEVVDHFETRRRRKDGKVIHVSLSVSPIKDASGKIIGASTIARDITERKRAEEQLREQREWLKVTLTSVGDAVLATDSEAKIAFLNPVAEALTGWSNNEALNKPAQEVFRTIDEQTGKAAEDVISKVLRQGCTVALANHTALVTRYGRAIPIEDSAAPIKDSEGNISGVVLVFHDVTERRRAREALRESEERFRVMANSIPQLSWIAKADGHVYWYNDRWYEYTGTRPEQMEGWGWQSVHDPAVLPDVLERWKESIATGKVFDMVFPLRGADGNFRQFLTRVEPVKDAGGNVIQWCGTNTDITERKHMEEELRRGQLQFKLLSETAGNLLASDNPQFIVNELCRNVMVYLDCHCFFNFLVDEIVGKLHLNAYAGIAAEEAKKIEWLEYGVAVCGCVARDRERIIAEDIFNTPDIRTELVESYGMQAYASHPLMVQGKLIGTLSFGTRTRKHFSSDDLALMKTIADQVAVAMERVRLIEGLSKSRGELEMRVEERTAELKSFMARLEQSNQALQDFASIAAHDLQEPLRKVITFGNMVKQRYIDSLGQTGSDYISRMLDATQRMQSLLKGLLEYSRVATQANPFVKIDLGSIVSEVLSDLEVRIQSTGAEVHILELPVVTADPTQMRQVFQNLISNALKFNKEGEKPVIVVHSALADGKLQIVVEDNGIGFEEQYIDKIFVPFQRLHGRSGQREGTGMGLAICKKIVERHGWSITAESTPGSGAKFIIQLPRT